MEKFGLSYEAVEVENPGVVYCSISGFGEEQGASLPGYDLLVQAVGGLMSITGQPGGEPTKVGVALVDIITGLGAVIGIQAALRARDDEHSPVRGHGQHVRVNLLSSLLSALANQTSSTLETGISPSRMGNAHPSISPYETFDTADQTIAVAVGTNAQFTSLCRVLDISEIAEDPKFVSNEQRVTNRAELRVVLEAQLKRDPAESWIERFTQHNIPAGRVNTIAQALELAESLGLNPVATTHSAVVADSQDTAEQLEVRTVANPLDLSRTPANYHLPPPELGEHNGAEWLSRD